MWWVYGHISYYDDVGDYDSSGGAQGAFLVVIGAVIKAFIADAWLPGPLFILRKKLLLWFTFLIMMHVFGCN